MPLVFIVVKEGMFSLTLDVYFSVPLLNCVFQHKVLSVTAGSLSEMFTLEASQWIALADIFSCSEQTNYSGAETLTSWTDSRTQNAKEDRCLLVKYSVLSCYATTQGLTTKSMSVYGFS